MEIDVALDPELVDLDHVMLIAFLRLKVHLADLLKLHKLCKPLVKNLLHAGYGIDLQINKGNVKSLTNPFVLIDCSV